MGTDAQTSTAPAAKICTVCGKDCSALPRTKDAQGRYICQPCVERVKEGRATQLSSPPPRAVAGGAPARSVPSERPVQAAGAVTSQVTNRELKKTASATATGVGRGVAAGTGAINDGNSDVMSQLLHESVEHAKQGCPNCHAAMKRGQMLCMGCGFNRELGKQLHTVVQKPVEVKGEKSKGGIAVNPLAAVAWLMNPWLVIGVPTALLFITGFLAKQDPEQFIPFFLGVAGVYYLMTVIYIFIDAMEESLFHALAAVLFWPYQLYHVFVNSDNGILKIMWLINFVSVIAARVLLKQERLN